MTRQRLAGYLSLTLALVWAALLWPPIRDADDPTGGGIGGWLMVAIFTLVAAGLWLRPTVARWGALVATALIVAFQLIAIPLVFGGLVFPRLRLELKSIAEFSLFPL